MTPATWPGTVNQNVLRDGFTVKPEANRISFKPETGKAKRRRRTTIATELVTYGLLLTLDEFADLLDFWHDDLLDGTLPFTFTDPLDEAEKTYEFVDDAEPEAMSPTGLYVTVYLHLLRWP